MAAILRQAATGVNGISICVDIPRQCSPHGIRHFLRQSLICKNELSRVAKAELVFGNQPRCVKQSAYCWPAAARYFAAPRSCPKNRIKQQRAKNPRAGLAAQLAAIEVRP